MLTDQKILRTFGPVLQITDGHKVHKYPHQYSHPTSSCHSQKCSGHFRASAMDGRAELLQFPDQEEQANVHHQPSYLKARHDFCSGLVHLKTVGMEPEEDHKGVLLSWNKGWGQQACHLLCVAITTNTEAVISSIGHMICKNKYRQVCTWPHRQNQRHPAWPEACNGEKEVNHPPRDLEQPLLLPAKQPIKMSANLS